MTHRQHMTNTEQELAVMSAPLMACPNCGHGIDPHGTDPGGICGVGDENRDRCPCLLSPNAIANLLLAAAWDEGHEAGWDDLAARSAEPHLTDTPNPYRTTKGPTMPNNTDVPPESWPFPPYVILNLGGESRTYWPRATPGAPRAAHSAAQGVAASQCGPDDARPADGIVSGSLRERRGRAMSDWTTARVVRDRDGDLWFRGCDSDSMWTANTDYPDVFLTSDEVVEAFGPLTPVLDADGLPVVRTVGDLTARHIGKRVRVQTDRTLPHSVRLLREIATASNEQARLTLEVVDHPEWFLMAWFSLDTPCELLPEGDA